MLLDFEVPDRCAPAGLRVTWALAKQTVVVVMWGELDLAGLERAAAALRTAQDLAPRSVCVDLRPLAFIDAAGVGVLASAWRGCEEAGVRSRLILGPGPVARTLALVGIPDSVDVVEDEAPADRLAGSLSLA